MRTIHDYVGRCEDLEGDLWSDLLGSSTTTDDQAPVRDAKAMGRAAWLAWADENHAAVTKFLRATSAKRSNAALWGGPAVQQQLAVAAIRRVRQAVAILGQLNDGFVTHTGALHDVVESAAHAAHRVWQEADWPFGEGDVS